MKNANYPAKLSIKSGMPPMKCISFAPLRFFLLKKKGFRASRSGFRQNANGLPTKGKTTFCQTRKDLKPNTK